MTEYVYRFRSMDKLLGPYRELERLEFYLSSSKELNDPMEGLQDVYWRGDAVLWENLLRHYTLALLMGTVECSLREDDSFQEPSIAATITEMDLPTQAFRETYHKACSDFLRGISSVDMPKRLAAARHPLRAHSLCFTLSLLHPFALDAVTKALRDGGLLPAGWPAFGVPEGIPAIEAWLDALAHGQTEANEAEVGWLASEVNHMREEFTIRLRLEAGEDIISASTRKKDFLFVSFPNHYVQGIADVLIHPEWRVVCFSSDCTNPSMWSTYADGHRGAALMFRVQGGKNGKPELPLRGVMGFQGSRPLRMDVRLPIHQVLYERRPPEIDFFRFIATLPRPKLMASWHAAARGESSPIVQEILNNEEAWREDLLALFHRIATTKLPDWKHEREHRLVFDDWFGTRKGHPKFTFNATSLAGIVFGLRTSTEHKIRIIRLLKEKHNLAVSDQFSFYEMVYSPIEGGLIRRRINSIQQVAS